MERGSSSLFFSFSNQLDYDVVIQKNIRFGAEDNIFFTLVGDLLKQSTHIHFIHRCCEKSRDGF